MASRVQELESAVSQLSPRELSRFRSWFEEFEASLWDRQIEADAAAGKLDKIADEALAEHRAGKSKVL